ncbi:MAG: Dps family protein [Thermoplasmata archaeon]|nr:DNA starvation/stationary phase protection protein [Thermoplasmata archaeon]
MPDSAPATLLDHLRREQANATCLYLQYKGYHWNVSGSLFRELHLMFDEHAKTVLDTADEFAERQRMHGARAPYTLDEMRTLQELPAEDGRPADAGEMLERLREAHLEIIGGLKAAFQTAEEIDDPGSADLFARTVQLHEKMEWFLREHLVEAAVPSEGLHAGTVTSATIVTSSR